MAVTKKSFRIGDSKVYNNTELLYSTVIGLWTSWVLLTCCVSYHPFQLHF